MSKLLLATSSDPKLLNDFFNEETETIKKVTIISIDYPLVEVYNGEGPKTKVDQSIFNKKQNQAVMFDVVGLIVDINTSQSQNEQLNNTENKSNEKKVFILANEVMFIINENNKLILINGNFDVIPNELISKIYANYSELKSIDLKELEEILELSRDETAIKAFYKLGNYFTAKKYEINNNIFNLIQHQEEAEAVAKKVLLKKMITWEIRK